MKVTVKLSDLFLWVLLNAAAAKLYFITSQKRNLGLTCAMRASIACKDKQSVMLLEYKMCFF
jgi:hypothetical protein